MRDTSQPACTFPSKIDAVVPLCTASSKYHNNRTDAWIGPETQLREDYFTREEAFHAQVDNLSAQVAALRCLQLSQQQAESAATCTTVHMMQHNITFEHQLGDTLEPSCAQVHVVKRAGHVHYVQQTGQVKAGAHNITTWQINQANEEDVVSQGHSQGHFLDSCSKGNWERQHELLLQLSRKWPCELPCETTSSSSACLIYLPCSDIMCPGLDLSSLLYIVYMACPLDYIMHLCTAGF
jgi:hypothetical protein